MVHGAEGRIRIVDSRIHTSMDLRKTATQIHTPMVPRKTGTEGRIRVTDGHMPCLFAKSGSTSVEGEICERMRESL
jgi:hypothetical protein